MTSKKKSIGSKKPAIKKKTASKKKATSKKKPPSKKGTTSKKRIAKKAKLAKSVNGLTSWEVRCSKEGIIKKGLTRSKAKELAEQHELDYPTHKATWTSSQ